MIGNLRSRNLNTLKHPISGKWEARCAGVSLLEVLVSITLAMVMLSSVWSLTSILTRRFESHLNISETNQMLRSLHQQLSHDFNSLMRQQSAAVKTSPLESNASLVSSSTDSFASSSVVTGSESQSPMISESFPSERLNQPIAPSDAFRQVDEFGQEFGVENFASAAPLTTLRGNPDQMTLIVFTDPVDLMLQGIRRQRLSESDDRQSGNQQTKRIAFKKIRYFGMPASRDLLSGDNDFDADYGMESSLMDSPSASASFPESKLLSRVLTREETDQRLEDQRQPPRIDSVSQITHFRFSYFDGFAWRSSWNSDQERQLPQAIKVDFNLTQPKRSQRSTEYDGGGSDGFDTDRFDTDGNASERSQYPSGDEWEMESDDANLADSNDFDASQKVYQHTFIFCIGPTQNRPAGSGATDRSRSSASGSDPSQQSTWESLPGGFDDWNRQ